MIFIDGPGSGVFELDSLQFAAISGGRRLKAGAVTWSVSGSGLATISANGLVKAIRATDFDLPFDPSPSGQPTVIAKAGTDTTYQYVRIYGWEQLHGLAQPVAYLKDEAYLLYGITLAGVDSAGVLFSGTGSLILTCGTVVAGHWTVEIGLVDMDELEPSTLTRNLFSTDTVSVAFDDQVRKLERWQRVGNRLRAVDGDDMVRRMLRARRVAMTAQGYTSPSYVYDGSLNFTFRLGNVKQVTQAAVFRACN